MPELIEIKITALVVTARYGALSPGDLLRTDAAFARHLVEDCAAAKYQDPRPDRFQKPVRSETQADQTPAKPATTRKKKQPEA